MVIAIDLDDTLINTRQVKADILLVTRKFGINDITATRIRRAVTDRRGFTIERYARKLFPKDAVHAIACANDLRTLFVRKRRYNYSGVVTFLKKLQKTHRLVLLSYGPAQYQGLKLAQSELRRFFKQIILTPDKRKSRELKTLRQEFGPTTVVIDNDATVARLARHLGMQGIAVRSGSKDSAYFTKLLKKIK